MKICPFCYEQVDEHADETYKEVSGWVHGKKKDSLTLRQDTGRAAHPHCIQNLKEGQDPAQPSMFEEES
jgi:hypothetical protein